MTKDDGYGVRCGARHRDGQQCLENRGHWAPHVVEVAGRFVRFSIITRESVAQMQQEPQASAGEPYPPDSKHGGDT